MSWASRVGCGVAGWSLTLRAQSCWGWGREGHRVLYSSSRLGWASKPTWLPLLPITCHGRSSSSNPGSPTCCVAGGGCWPLRASVPRLFQGVTVPLGDICGTDALVTAKRDARPVFYKLLFSLPPSPSQGLWKALLSA